MRGFLSFAPSGNTSGLADSALAHNAAMPALKGQVIAQIRMALWAACFFRMGRADRIASKYICASRNGLEVCRVYTKSVLTQMINLQAMWDRPLVKLVRKAVRIESSERLPAQTNCIPTVNNGREFCISNGLAARPEPAAIGLLDLCHKQIRILFNDLSHAQDLFSSGLKCKTE